MDDLLLWYHLLLFCCTAHTLLYLSSAYYPCTAYYLSYLWKYLRVMVMVMVNAILGYAVCYRVCYGFVIGLLLALPPLRHPPLAGLRPFGKDGL